MQNLSYNMFPVDDYLDTIASAMFSQLRVEKLKKKHHNGSPRTLAKQNSLLTSVCHDCLRSRKAASGRDNETQLPGRVHALEDLFN
uniref:Uncharacterized protein n=1 Tax=Salix viminalis TaxID=40686 RepID=A0A6N2LZC0_SALVM